jgi:hypothetical protein
MGLGTRSSVPCVRSRRQAIISDTVVLEDPDTIPEFLDVLADLLPARREAPLARADCTDAGSARIASPPQTAHFAMRGRARSLLTS